MRRHRKQQRGMTLIELIVAFTIMLLLTTMAVPLARSRVKRNREHDLRIALDDMRKAIDKYKDMCDGGKLGIQKQDAMCYPESLEALVEGVKGSGQNADVKLKFLRRIPKDPMTNSYDWGKRSMQDDPKARAGAGRMFSMFIPKATTKLRMELPIPSGKSACAARLYPDRNDDRDGDHRDSDLRRDSVLPEIDYPGQRKRAAQNNLFTMRTLIDEYSYDKQKAPQSLAGSGQGRLSCAKCPAIP